MEPEDISKVVRAIEDAAKLHGIEDAYFVGGYPRAIAMGAPLSDVHDIDVGTSSPSHGPLLAGFVAEQLGGEIKTRHRSATSTVDLGFTEIDFQAPAAHEATLPYLHAQDIEPTPLAMNIFDRDFTINSLALPVNGPLELIDLTERGLRDLDQGKIVSILPAEFAISRDPLLITRAIKFAYKYGFTIDGKLWEAMKRHAPELKEKVSEHRLMVEAEVLSQYNTKSMLKELGLDYLINMSGDKS